MSKLDMTWRCGHPRSAENTRKCGVAGVRCAICRRAIDAKHYLKVKAALRP